MVEYGKSAKLVDAALSLDVLRSLDGLYPDFGHWYVNKVMPGILMGVDILICAKDAGRVVGVALGKKGASETKLRCVRVDEAYQSKGVGLHLIDRMLVELGADKPYCTVAEEMLHQFSRAFINRYKFDLDEVDKGMYRVGKLEYVFNQASAPAAGADPFPYPAIGAARPADAAEEELSRRVFAHLAPKRGRGPR